MRVLHAAAVASLVMTPFLAAAEPINGMYINFGGGYNSHGDRKSLAGDTPSLGIRLSGEPKNLFKEGGIGIAAIGWGFGDGFRLELEGSYRQNAVWKNVTGPRYKGDERQYTLAVNGYYDINTGTPFTPYFGGGAGLTVVSWNPVTRVFNGIPCCAYFGSPLTYSPTADVSSRAEDAVLVPSVQLMAGLKVDVPGVPGLQAGVQYRFFLSPGDVTFKNYLSIRPSAGSTGTPVAAWSATTYSGNRDHSAMFTLTYAFGKTPAAPAAVVAAPAAAQVSRTYLVFFDWDRADLTTRAQQIIAEAAQASTKVATTRIEVAGHADRSGTPAYNQALSLRRGNAVAAELVKQGVAKSAISITAFGDTKPLVPTAAGVREPQNRRVEIVLK